MGEGRDISLSIPWPTMDVGRVSASIGLSALGIAQLEVAPGWNYDDERVAGRRWWPGG